MIIDKNKNIIKEIKRLSSEKQEREKDKAFAYSYVRNEICKDLGYKSYQEFYKENRRLWYNLLFKKHKKINFKNMLHVGNVNNAPHKEFRLCRSDLTTHVFIEESKQIEEKASLIYAKKILKQNDNKICYIIDNKEIYNNISEYINKNEIAIKMLEKISFSLSRKYFFSFIDYILKITNENELFEQLEYSERKYMLDYFFDNKVFESIFVNGVTKVMNISEKILSNIVIYLKGVDCQDFFEYSEIKNAIINGLEKIKENFTYDYTEQNDVHKLILNEENILLEDLGDLSEWILEPKRLNEMKQLVEDKQKVEEQLHALNTYEEEMWRELSILSADETLKAQIDACLEVFNGENMLDKVSASA